MLGSRKNPKPEKCLKMPQNPTRQVHALLGNCPLTRTFAEKRRHRQHDKILQRILLLTNTQKLYANQNACWKKTNLTLKQNNS